MVEITREFLQTVILEQPLLLGLFNAFSYDFPVSENQFTRKELSLQWNDYTKDKKSKWYLFFSERDLKDPRECTIVCLRDDLVYLEDLQLIYKGITNKDL